MNYGDIDGKLKSFSIEEDRKKLQLEYDEEKNMH